MTSSSVPTYGAVRLTHAYGSVFALPTHLIKRATSSSIQYCPFGIVSADEIIADTLYYVAFNRLLYN